MPNERGHFNVSPSDTVQLLRRRREGEDDDADGDLLLALSFA